MRFSFLSGKTIGILGLGRTGLESAQQLQQAGVEVWVWDDQPAARQKATDLSLKIVDLLQADLSQLAGLLISPGIPHTYPAPHPVAARAKQADCPFISDLDLLIQDVPQPRRIGITGTNGKSTTTALVHHILSEAKLPTAIGGNFGPAALTLPALPDHGVYVLELSSYQLELCYSLACDAAILLNITPDHLSRHGGMAGYIAAKQRLFELQKPEASLAFIGIGTAETYQIYKTISRDRPGECFAFQMTENPDDLHPEADLVLTEGRLHLAVKAKSKPFFRAFPEQGIILAQNPALQGLHNIENMAAAALAVASMGIAWSVIAAAFQTFPGLAHRMQPVEVSLDQAILCINDSKATNAEAAEKALGSFEDIFWIAGGQAKEGGISALVDQLQNVVAAFVIGEAAEDFANSLFGHCPVTESGTLQQAVQAAFQAAQTYRQQKPESQPVILLSPAAASWDQFKSFEDRGIQFCQFVAEEMAAHG